jgi:RsiW-degrading membrane proteinase PrsW (M82 family)
MSGKELQQLFFVLPILPILAVYILAAVIPAVILLRYIYRHDTMEQEPAGLLVVLLFMGVIAALCSGVLEGIAQSILGILVAPGSRLHTILLAFLVVAAVEEGMKFWLLRRRTWRHPAFNYRFDGIVYAVAVSLGFAAFENIFYVFSYGLQVAVSRALLAVPAHTAFAVYMGAFYGRAKYLDVYGQHKASKANLFAGFLVASALHAFYDSCAMLGSDTAMLVFAVFVIAMYIIVIRRVRTESRTDHPF